MNTERLRELYARLESEKDLCTWASIYSMITWNKIGFTRSLHRARLYETSLTQDLVFQFYLSAKTGSYPVEIFESWDEATHGNDLDIFIQKEGGYVHVPVQAKLISSDGRYAKINHRVGTTYQMDALIDYAILKGGIPLYLFYNYVMQYDWREDEYEHGRSIEEYGCSFVHADTIRRRYKKLKKRVVKWKIPRFEELHPSLAIPFSDLFCGLLKQPLFAWPGILGNNLIAKPVIYSYEEITDEDSWRNMTPPAQISGLHEDVLYKIRNDFSDQLEEDQGKPFDPKYRVIFSTGRKRKGGLKYLV